MTWTNYHQHCHYCDGTESVDAHVIAAIQQGITSMGFSCHCPVPFDNNWSMKKADLPAYFDEIEQAKLKHHGKIAINRSLEIDYIPGIIDISEEWLQQLPLDYTIGSVHFVGSYENGRPWEIDGPHQVFLDGLTTIYDDDVQQVVTKYFELTRHMVREVCPDVIGHLDKIKMQNRGFWNEDDDWYKNEILATLEEIRAKKAIVEVNTRGMYKKLTMEPYPGRWVLEHILRMNIPVQINSDAHHPREITSHFSETAGLLKAVGFTHLMAFLNGQWQPVPFNENGLQID
jgi:histidinol-phosphatase (PHP family)